MFKYHIVIEFHVAFGDKIIQYYWHNFKNLKIKKLLLNGGKTHKIASMIRFIFFYYPETVVPS